MSNITEIPCPICKKTVPWVEESLHRPFCSERCQLIDLGEWADEGYTIPVSEEDDDIEEWQ